MLITNFVDIQNTPAGLSSSLILFFMLTKPKQQAEQYIFVQR